MKSVGVHEAKTHLSKLLRRVGTGEEIVITRGGEPIAKLVGVGEPNRRILGRDQGAFQIPEDFDAPLPEAVIAGFEG
ncbi:MAG: type II toxin-antitoxin system Phd/YefM family antitoxin [Acidimicrobiia bacterium]